MMSNVQNWPSWNSTEALAYSGLSVTCATPEDDWLSAYTQQRIFGNIAQTQAQNDNEIAPLWKNGVASYVSPSRINAMIEGRGCVRGMKDEIIGAAADASLPSLAALGYLPMRRPEIVVGTVFEGKAHGDERECPVAMPVAITDFPDNLTLSPDNPWDERKKDAERLRVVLGNLARSKLAAFQSMGAL